MTITTLKNRQKSKLARHEISFIIKLRLLFEKSIGDFNLQTTLVITKTAKNLISTKIYQSPDENKNSLKKNVSIYS